MSSSASGSSRLWSAVRLRQLAFPLFIVFLVTPLLADSHARIVRLSYVDGDVEIDKGDGRGFNTAYMNMPVAHGWKLWARNGQAEAELEDGSSIRVTPDTIIAFTDLSLDSRGHRNTTVELQQGAAYFDIHRRDDDRFNLEIGRERVELVRSAHFRVDIHNGETEVAVLSGEVQVSNGSGGDVAVNKDETIRLYADDANRYYLAKGVDVENYDTWDNERTKGHDADFSSAAVGGNSANNGVTYGLSDLNAYGSYFYVPGYGYMWRPSSASLAWDPFGDGYWLSYPGSGYVFVSSYPWGWRPFRYGSWHFVNGRGWCWAPGSHWNSWHRVPPIRNVPPYYHHPEAPHHGPPVVAVNNGRPLSVPGRRMVIDNDALEHRRPPAFKVATGNVLRQRQSQTNAPTAGFASSTTANPSPVGSPGISGVETPRQIPPSAGSYHRWENSRDRRDADFDRARHAPQIGPSAVGSSSMPSSRSMAPPPSPSMPQHSPGPSSPLTRSEARPSGPSMSPRMEPHSSPHSMGPSPGMGSSRSAGPSVSSGGGGRASSGSHGGGSGGGRSGGNHR